MSGSYLSAHGVPVFPCDRASKKPLVSRGFYAASASPDLVARWEKNYPGCLWGVPTGAATGLFVVDADVSKETGAAVGEAMLLIRFCVDASVHRYVQRTRRGGVHLFFRWRPGLRSVSREALKIDTRGEGGFVIAWAPEAVAAAVKAQLPPPPADLVDGLGAGPRLRFPCRTSFPLAGAADLEEVEELLRAIPATLGYDEWRQILMAVHAATGGSDGGLALADAWSATGGSCYPGSAHLASKWRSFRRSGVTSRTLAHFAKQYGANVSEIARRHARRRRHAS